jgi:hypothetical protein
VALAAEMRMAPAEVYEVATFYHHFDVVKEGDDTPPRLTVKELTGTPIEFAILKGLAKKPNDRFLSAHDFLAALGFTAVRLIDGPLQAAALPVEQTTNAAAKATTSKPVFGSWFRRRDG